MPSTLLRAINCSVKHWVGGISWVEGSGLGVEEKTGDGEAVGDAVKRSKEFLSFNEKFDGGSEKEEGEREGSSGNFGIFTF